MKRRTIAIVLAALTALGSAAAVASMYYGGPHAGHATAMYYKGPGG